MRFLANYFREAFCKHDFNIEEEYVNGVSHNGLRVYICGAKLVGTTQNIGNLNNK